MSLSEKKPRNSNIELLRILAIMGVLVLHYNNADLGGGFKYVTAGSLNHYVLLLLEGCAICAVDLFIMISGFFLAENQKRNVWRVIELVAQVMIFSFGFYLLNVLFGKESFTLKSLAASLIPANYFVILYSVVFLISPFINKLMKSLDTKQLDFFMLLLFLLFSVYPTAVDILCELTGKQISGLSSVGAYGSQWGFSAVNFILMYCIGAYLKLSKMKKPSNTRILFIFGVCVLISVVWSRINDSVGYFTVPSAYEYCNPVVILMAVCLLLLFSNIDMGTIKWVNHVSKCCFSVFLTNGFFIGRFAVEKAVNRNVFIMLLHITAVVLILFAIGYISHVLYVFITKPVWRILESKLSLPEIKVE